MRWVMGGDMMKNMSIGPSQRLDIVGNEGRILKENVKTYGKIAGKVREAIGKLPGFDAFVKIKDVDGKMRYVKIKDILSHDTIANNALTAKEKMKIAKVMVDSMQGVKHGTKVTPVEHKPKPTPKVFAEQFEKATPEQKELIGAESRQYNRTTSAAAHLLIKSLETESSKMHLKLENKIKEIKSSKLDAADKHSGVHKAKNKFNDEMESFVYKSEGVLRDFIYLSKDLIPLDLKILVGTLTPAMRERLLKLNNEDYTIETNKDLNVCIKEYSKK
jgi:hypothetical protein